MGILLPGIQFTGNNQGIEGVVQGWIDLALDWSMILAFGIKTSEPSPFRTAFCIGDPTFTNPYVWIGADNSSDEFYLQIWDGATAVNSTKIALGIDTWFRASLVHVASTHVTTLRINNATIGTVTVDLTGLFTGNFFRTILGDFSGTVNSDMFAAYHRMWQAALTADELRDEAKKSFPVRHLDLLTDTPLLAFPGSGIDDGGYNLGDMLGYQGFTLANARNFATIGDDPTAHDGPTTDCVNISEELIAFIYNDGIQRFYDPSTGYEVGQRTLAYPGTLLHDLGDSAFTLPTGEWSFRRINQAANTSFYGIMSADLTTVIGGPYVTAGHLPGQGPAAGAGDHFYVGQSAPDVGSHDVSTVKQISRLDGSVTATLTLQDVASPFGYEVLHWAVSPDDTILYHTGTNTNAIRRHDINSDTPLTDLYTPTYTNEGLYVLPDGTVLAATTRIQTGPDTTLYTLLSITAGGVLNWSVDLQVNAAHTDPSFSITATADGSKIWVQYPTYPLFGSGFFATLQSIDPADGSVIDTFFPFNSQITRYALAMSRVAIADCVVSGSIVVTKITSPPDSPEQFTFHAGGGVSPTDFTLGDGDTQTLAGVVPGSGYSVLEDPVDSWSTLVTVSNGSPSTNITVADGEEVLVTFTNALSQTFPLIRERIFALVPPYNQMLNQFISQIEILGQPGTGNSNSPAPTLTVSLSKDGGQTYVITRTVEIGAATEYLTRWRSTNWGKARNPVVRICTSEAVFIGLLECYVDSDAGVH